MQTELNKANDEILARREIKKEQEKAEEMKVIEYMKQKAVSYLHVFIYGSNIVLHALMKVIEYMKQKAVSLLHVLI